MVAAHHHQCYGIFMYTSPVCCSSCKIQHLLGQVVGVICCAVFPTMEVRSIFLSENAHSEPAAQEVLYKGSWLPAPVRCSVHALRLHLDKGTVLAKAWMTHGWKSPVELVKIHGEMLLRLYGANKGSGCWATHVLACDAILWSGCPRFSCHLLVLWT